MNIAFFTESYPPQKSGVSACVDLEKKYLEKLGHKVYIITPHINKKYDQVGDEKILYTPSWQLFLEKNDQRVGLPDYNQITLFLYNKNIDIVHTHTDLFLAGAALMWAREHSVPIVHTMHTHWSEYIKRHNNWSIVFSEKRVSSIYRYFFKHVATVISPSVKAKTIAEKYTQKTKVSVVANAVIKRKKTNQHFRKRFGIVESDFVLVNVGRISDEKRPYELTSSLISVLKKHRDIKLVFIGRGMSEEKITELAKIHNLESQIILTGFMKTEQIVSSLVECDVYITASLSEMHSISILEGLEAGLPIVVRQDSAYIDTVITDYNGFQVSSDRGLAKAVLSLYADPKKKKIFSRNSKKLSGNFTPRVHVQKLLKVYKNALKNRNKVAVDSKKTA